MAKPILEDQAVDYSKPFVVEFTYRDANRGLGGRRFGRSMRFIALLIFRPVTSR